MADLDRELSDRLSRLAAGVPVASGHLDPVHRSAVAARQRVRMAWLTPLVFVVIVAALTTMLGIGPFAPAGNDGNGPLEATAKSGDFELKIRSDKAHYESGESIAITASLTYLGPEGSIRITHAGRANHGPIGFEITEPVIGNLHVSQNIVDTRSSTELRRGEAFTVPFQKGGAWDGSDPRSDDFLRFLQDPVLRLPPGIWHLNADANFSVGGEDGHTFGLRAGIPIEVRPAASNAPSRSPAPDEPVIATDTDGQFELVIRSTKARYMADEAIEVKAGLAYQGANVPVEIWHGLGAQGSPIAFGIQEPVLGNLKLEPVYETACAQSELNGFGPIALPFWKSAGWSGLDEAQRQFLFDPALRLPPGRWHLYAVAEFSVGACDVAPIRMRVDIEIEVEPAAASDPVVSVVHDGAFDLAITSAKARYRPGEPVEVKASLTYRGSEASVSVWHGFGSPMSFGVVEPVNGQVLTPGWRLSCGPSTLEQGVPYERPGTRLRELPVGTWHVYVVADFGVGECGVDRHLIRADLEIVVGDTAVPSP